MASPTRGVLANLHAAMHNRWQGLQARLEQGSPERAAARADLPSPDEILALTKRARDAFAKLNNWTVSQREYTLEDIGRRVRAERRDDEIRSQLAAWPLLNRRHGYHKDGQYVALVGEPYELGRRQSALEQFRLWLNGLGLDLFTPPDPLASTWFPGGTLFLVMAAQGADVRCPSKTAS